MTKEHPEVMINAEVDTPRAGGLSQRGKKKKRGSLTQETSERDAQSSKESFKS